MKQVFLNKKTKPVKEKSAARDIDQVSESKGATGGYVKRKQSRQNALRRKRKTKLPGASLTFCSVGLTVQLART